MQQDQMTGCEEESLVCFRSKMGEKKGPTHTHTQDRTRQPLSCTIAS